MLEVFHFCSTFTAIVGLLSGTAAVASESCQLSAQAGVSSVRRADTNAYCGIRSLHTALSLLGRHVPFETLVRPEYVSTRQGSAMTDLLVAAADAGVHAYPTSRLNGAALMQITVPVILHVKNTPGAKSYNHWVTFAGMSGNDFRLYDGAVELQLSAAELAGRWGGTGLVLSTAGISPVSIEAPAIAWLVRLCGIVLLLVGLARLAVKHTARATAIVRSGPVQAGAIVAIAAIAAEFSGALTGQRFLGDAPSVQSIQEAHTGSFLPHVDGSLLQQLLSDGNVIVVDARWRSDYDLGHITGAVCIEPDSSELQCLQALSSVPRDALVVVYCQSNVCPYSANIATRLATVGFRDVRIYSGGWVEWDEPVHIANLRP